MAHHGEARPDEVVRTTSEPATDHIDVVVGLEAAEQQMTVVEAWEPNVTLEFARRLGVTMVHGFGHVSAAVEASGGRTVIEENPETDEELTVLTTPGGWLDEIVPDTALVPLARAGLLGRIVTPVTVDEEAIHFGWTVAELPRSSREEPEVKSDEDASVPETGSRRASLLEVDDDEPINSDVEAEDGDGDDLDVVVDRVVLVEGVRHPLRLLTGTRRQLGDGLTRLAVIKPRVIEDPETGKDRKVPPREEDMRIIGEYADRNGYSTVKRQVITPEVLARGELDAEDPVRLGLKARSGLATLARRVGELDRLARGRLAGQA